MKGIKFIYIAVFFIAALMLSSATANAVTLTGPVAVGVKVISAAETDIVWRTVTGASKYSVYRAVGKDSGYVKLGSTTGRILKDRAIKPGITYWYFVRAYNSRGKYIDSKHYAVAPRKVSTVKREFIGFTTKYYSGDSSSYNSLIKNSSLLNEIVTFTYKADKDGNLTGEVPQEQLDYAKQKGIKTTVLITNNFDPAIADSILVSPDNRSKLIENIYNVTVNNGYKGVNMDFEMLYSSDRDLLTTFMNELYSKMHTAGLEVSICVPAKTDDNPIHTWNYAFDYKGLSAYCDKFIVMAYDEHYRTGQPGPIASLNWVRSVVKYTVSQVPVSKTILGIAAYGYDWSSKGSMSYGIPAVYKLAAKYNAKITWNPGYGSYYFVYKDEQGVSHTVWFENGTSMGYKLDVVNSYNLRGAAEWRLGLEDADYMAKVKAKIK